MVEREIRQYPEIPITHNVIQEMLTEYRRPNDKISNLIRSGVLVSLRRGLYIPGPETDVRPPDLFLIANHLRGPSYVSLQSALSHWGMIPERVYETSSVTIRTPTVYNTPVGRFSYTHLPVPYYSFGIRSVRLSELQTAMIASPEKALCDTIVLTSGVNLRSMIQTEEFLFEDMRMDEDMTMNLDLSMIDSWLEDAPKRSSLNMLIRTINRL